MDHLPLYEQLVWDALSSGTVLSNGSVTVEGVMRGFVDHGRIVLRIDEHRMAELAARNLGAVYPENNRPGWFLVDPEVDEATFRVLFHEAVGAEARASLLAEFSQAIAADILALPGSIDPDWETFAALVEVSANSVVITAYRYTESGPPVSVDGPLDDDLFRALHDRIRNIQGEVWDVVVVKLHRPSGRLVLDFEFGQAAEGRRVTTANRDHLPESLRPRPEEFPGVPFLTAPVHLNEDVNMVVGDRTRTTPTSEAWPEVSRHRHAVWAGNTANGAPGLLVRAHGSDARTRVINHEAVGLVQLSGVIKRPDGGFQARLESIPPPPAGALDGVIDRERLRELLRRAADRDPTFVTGWRRAVMRSPLEVADLAFHAVAEDLLRRLVMPLSERIELMTRPERERFQILVDQLRDVADGARPQPEMAQRLDRPLIDLPPHPVPVLAAKIWLTPGNVSTIKASDFISDQALAAGWLAFTTELTVGRAAMATRPLRRSTAAGADGRCALTTDQIRPAIIVAVVPGVAGRSLVVLAPAPSAEEAAGRALPEPVEERERLSAYLELLRLAYARDSRVLGTSSGSAHRLWQAGRFTSLRALLSWQIGQLGFSAQSVLDLQAIAWPDRLRALTQVLQTVVGGRPLSEARTKGAQTAVAALHSSEVGPSNAADPAAQDLAAAATEPDSTATAELSDPIAAAIWALPELRDPAWDTYAMVAEVSDFSVKMTAYRYTEFGPPVPAAAPADSFVFIQLRDRIRATRGEAWDVVIVKLHRETRSLMMDFASGASADRWRVTPANMTHLPEALRPGVDDFTTR